MAEFTDTNNPGDSGKDPERSPIGGYLLLGLILIVCITIAIFLSNIMSRQLPPVEDIILTPGGQNLSQSRETVIPDTDELEEPPESPGDSIEDTIAQVRGLAIINDAISSFRLSEGHYPEYISEVINQPGFDIPENRLVPGIPIQPIEPGNFYPGGFSYLPYGNDGEEISGYILVSYAGTEEAGITIYDPEEIIQPADFKPSIGAPLIGVAIVMLEGGDTLDLSDYR